MPIAYAKENLLADLPDEPIFGSIGSGLSAKNIVYAPEAIIALLGKIRAKSHSEK